MSTVLKKGAPSRSYPSRQRKLGPAPFASFEDLSDELESPADPRPNEQNKMEVLPEIREDVPNSPLLDEYGHRCHNPVTATSSTSTVTFAPSYSAPTSGPTSGLQTPSTPRIDISCASSSSTPPSDDSASEKELFQGGLGFAFHEEGQEELKSSTEELDLGDAGEGDSEEERRRKRKEEQELHRRSSQPANLFSCRRKSSTTGGGPGYRDYRDRDRDDDDDDVQRKPSAHTLFLDGLLSRPACRHASFGSADYGRPGALSSLSAHSSGSVRGRSPSPHKMMLETSFCGNKPIPTKSMDMESPPKEKDVGTTPTATKTTTSSSRHREGLPNRTDSDASIYKKKPISISNLNTSSSQVGHNLDIDIEQFDRPPRSPRSPQSPRDFDRRPSSTGRRSVSPFKMVYETSFCGSKPIPTRSMEQDSPPKDPSTDFDLTLGGFLARQTLTTVQVHPHQTTGQSPQTPNDNQGLRPEGSPESPKSSDHWKPISPRLTTPLSVSPGPRSSPGNVSDRSSLTSSASSVVKVNVINSRRQDTNIFKWPEPGVSPGQGSNGSKSKSQQPTSSSTPKGQSTDKKQTGKGTKIVAGSSPKNSSSTSGQGSTPRRSLPLENDEITTELKICEDPMVTVEDVPTESTGLFLFSSSFDDDGDLPYVPTTLPLEKSSVGPIFPSKERRSMSVTTTPVQRPRVNRPPAAATLHDYIATVSPRLKDGEGGSKMKINLPREDSLGAAGDSSGSYQQIGKGSGGGGLIKSPKKRATSSCATSWTDFAEMGLRSPRDIRRIMKQEENGATDDISSYHSDSSEAIGHANGSDEERESLLKLPVVPFAMDLDVKSNRSSLMEDPQHSPISPSVSSLPADGSSADSSPTNQQD